MKFSRKSRILTSALLGFAVAIPLFGQNPVAQAQTVSINGQSMQSGVQPIQRRGRTLVAMRQIFEGLGASVQWDANKHSITAKNDGVTVIMNIGSPYAVVNGKMVKLDQAPLLYRGNTMVPLRFVSEAMGASVNYNAQTQRISINTDGNSASSQAALVTLTPDKQFYLPQEPIKLTFAVSPSYKGNVGIELVSSDVPAGNPKITSANRESHNNIWSKTQGVSDFKAPRKLGTYEFRAQDSNKQLGSATIEVVAETADWQHEVWVDKTHYKLRENIVTHFKAVPFQSERIDLVSVDIPRGNPEITSANKIGHNNLWSKTQGTQNFGGPSKPGTYEMRMSDGNGNEVAYSKPFTVRGN